MTIRLLLADDHTMIRQTLRRSMESEGFAVVGEAGDGEEAVRLIEQMRPDVVLMDVSMPRLDGVEAARLVHQRAPEVQVIMLTMHADPDVVGRAIRAGAAGYLVKDCTMEEVVRTVRLAASGDAVLSPELAASMLQMATDSGAAETSAHGAGPTITQPGEPGMAEPAMVESVITKREEEVLKLIAEGLSTTEVAKKLYISVKTVKNHLASIYAKLESRDRTQAVVRAVRMGIIRLD